MKIFGAIGIAIMLLFVLTPAPAYSQGQDENKPPAGQEEKGKNKDKEKNKNKAKNDDNAAPKNEGKREQAAGGAHAQRGKMIPEEKFRASFGRQHTFRVQRTQVINNPQPVVVFAGYSFQFIDPWPAAWAFDDDCYIEYVDGEYFLFDVLHPEVRVAVFVVE
jgi:hypothetical protein